MKMLQCDGRTRCAAHKAEILSGLRRATATVAAWSTILRRGDLRRQGGRSCWRATWPRARRTRSLSVDVKSSRPLRNRSRPKKARRHHRLLEDRPFLYQAPPPAELGRRRRTKRAAITSSNPPIGRGYDDGTVAAIAVSRDARSCGYQEDVGAGESLPKTWASRRWRRNVRDDRKYGRGRGADHRGIHQP